MANEQVVDAAGTPEKQRLYAVFESVDNAAKAEQDLQAQGVTVQRLHGEEDTDTLATPDQTSLGGKIARFVKGFGGEDLEAKRYGVHLQNKRVVLVVSAANQDEAQALTGVMVAHDAFDVTYFGSWSIQHMSPAENRAHGMPTYESSTDPEELDRGDSTPGVPSARG